MSHKKEKKYIRDIPEFIVSVHNKEDLEKGYTSGSHTKIEFKCPDCGEIHNKEISKFTKSQRLKCRCVRNPYLIEFKIFVDMVVNKSDLMKYTTGSHTKIEFKCPECQNIFKSSISDVATKNDNGKCYCPYCRGLKVNSSNHAYNNFEMREWVFDIFDLKKYTQNSNKKIKWKCPKNHIFYCSLNNFKSGCRCPFCRNSRGENKILRILKQSNIRCKTQYRINDCKNKRPLPFDFAVLNNDKLIGLIEFHGKQHSHSIEYFGGDSALEYRQQNDVIKERYCKDNNIPLLIIWHYDNIEEKLKTFLNALGINN